MSDAVPAPTFDQLLAAAELKARTRPADQSNAVELPPAQNRAMIGQLGRDLAAFARPGWRTSREMHQQAERAANAG